jgi:hypothetical protein
MSSHLIYQSDGEVLFSDEDFALLRQTMLNRTKPNHLIYYYTERYQQDKNAGLSDENYRPTKRGLINLAVYMNLPNYNPQAVYEALWMMEGDLREASLIYSMVDDILTLIIIHNCPRDLAEHAYSVNYGNIIKCSEYISNQT